MLPLDPRVADRSQPIPFAAPKPLYSQVRDLLLTRVRQGEWGPGKSLPNEYQLSTQFDVSIATIRRAVGELQQVGVLQRKQGRGTYVAGTGTRILQEKFTSLLSPTGHRILPTYELTGMTRRAATTVERMRLPSAGAAGVVEISQIAIEDGARIGIETSVLPAELLPRLETQFRFGQHLYPLLADYGLLVTRVLDTLSVVPASPEQAAILAVEPAAPLLHVERSAAALEGETVEWRISHYLPTRVRYSALPPLLHAT